MTDEEIRKQFDKDQKELKRNEIEYVATIIVFILICCFACVGIVFSLMNCALFNISDEVCIWSGVIIGVVFSFFLVFEHMQRNKQFEHAERELRKKDKEIEELKYYK